MKHLLVLYFVALSLSVDAAPGYPKVGDRVPSHVLSDIRFQPRPPFDISKNNKPLVLDFFTQGCSACFASMPKVSELTKEFESKVDIILIGDDPEKLPGIYKKYHDRLKLNITVAFDSALFNKFGIPSVPFVVWVDAGGTIKSITQSISADALQKFVANQSTGLFETVTDDQTQSPAIKRNVNKPLLLKNNGGYDSVFLYRSVLAKWIPQSTAYSWPEVISYKLKGKLEATGVPLADLYTLAYGDTVIFYRPPSMSERKNAYGDWWPKAVLETKDNSLLVSDDKKRNNLYTYTLILPPGNRSSRALQNAMRADLDAAFPYKVSVELRKMPYWSLQVSPEARKLLATQGGNSSATSKDRYLGISLKNYPVTTLLSLLGSARKGEMPFVDETGIRTNIDLEIDALLTSYDDMCEELSRHGLSIVQAEKLMNVIVIKE